METPELCQAKVDALAERMIDILNSGALALMVSIGHRAGLFEVMASLPPATSQQIAATAGLQERYVREWLGAMVTGRIVDYDAVAKTCHLPPEHATALTQKAPHNFAVTAQCIPLCGTVEDQVVDSFRRGGGVPYAAYPRFKQIMAEESK